MSNENGTRGYPPHDLAPELDDLSHAYTLLQAENAALQQAIFRAHRLIGRLDFFLETYAAQPDRIQRQMAAKLRREIKEAGTR